MNAPERMAVGSTPPLHVLALAALGRAEKALDAGPEAHWLNAQATGSMQAWQAAPPQTDTMLCRITQLLGLHPVEVLAAALAVAVENDAMAGRVLAWLQAPAGGSRPTVGCVLAAASAMGISATAAALQDGQARQAGLLLTEADLHAVAARPLAEQALHVPLPLALALADGFSRWPGARLESGDVEGAAPSLLLAAKREADSLQRDGAILVVRSGSLRNARAAAALVARALGQQAAQFEAEPGTGAGLWLSLVGAVPVRSLELAPGEVRRLPRLPGHRGAVIIAAGPDGSIDGDGVAVRDWTVPLPSPAERAELWQRQGADATQALRLGAHYRRDAMQIEDLAQAARLRVGLAPREAIGFAEVAAAARSGGDLLGTLAERLPETIADDALVAPPALREALTLLRCRCERREALAESLGPAARSRYRSGVRALFVGASGTGKTLAALWLASRLGLPLYRVDMASVTSKYIGETEKHLAQLFARAEHGEVVLLFDEADALFGKRTEVKDANDRFANAQTNYLLQRIESFDGIAVLTSNSRARFDSAFTRRLDAIIEFPQPSPDERRALWVAHLGPQHGLTPAELNRISAACELAGGHVRNCTLAAASAEAGTIGYRALRRAIEAEYRKLGRGMPPGL